MCNVYAIVKKMFIDLHIQFTSIYYFTININTSNVFALD